MANSSHFNLTYADTAVPEEILNALRGSWDHIASAGPGWSSAQRVAIAAEARAAWDCDLCTERKAALTPNAVSGAHAATEILSEAAVEATHRIATDVSRLTKTWFDALAGDGLSAFQYTEIVGIAATVANIDGFCRALGIDLEPLPDPTDAPATGYTPERLTHGGAWVPLLMHNDLAAAEQDIYLGMPGTSRVMRALSCAPDEVRNVFHLGSPMYLSMADVPNPAAPGPRVLSRAQMELIAARVSAINECFY